VPDRDCLQVSKRIQHALTAFSYKDLISHAPEGDYLKIAPLRILSFDIECAGRKGIFPEANVDPVIQIAAMVTRQGELIARPALIPGEPRPFVRNVFTLNTCAHIVGSQVLEFKDERKLLLEWRQFVEKVDPDMIIGYNISNFDLPYLLDRAKALKIPEFAFLGRLKGRHLSRMMNVNLELTSAP
jgi:DNA polymerase delta subunit 1